MNIHEHQAKEILKRFGIPVLNGFVIFSTKEINKNIKNLKSKNFMIKAQIHAGGRGKAGGIKKVENFDELKIEAENMLGKTLKTHQTGPSGKKVKRLYIEETCNIVKGQTSPEQFVEIMKRSKVGISPFGMGELCYRDLELIQWGCLLLKPDMSKVITEPDFFKPMETYVPVKPDWSDLNEVVDKILGNYNDYLYIIENARKRSKVKIIPELALK